MKFKLGDKVKIKKDEFRENVIFTVVNREQYNDDEASYRLFTKVSDCKFYEYRKSSELEKIKED